MFKESSYSIVRNAVPSLLCRFVAEQFNLMLANSQLAFNDHQVEKAYFAYGLPVTEALLTLLLPRVIEETGDELLPTYSYSRVYLPGAELKKHRDRPSCEISATLALAQKTDKPWPIHIETKDGRDIDVELASGDMLIYAGLEVPHWRNPFEGEWQLQAFLHYVRKDGPWSNFVFDERPRLGAPKQVDGAQEK